MDILEKLDMLIEYYESTRGVGHTVLMLEGTRLRSCVIMARTHKCARELVRQSGGSVAMSWEEMSLLGVGHHLPLAIDNSAIYQLCLDAAQEIARLRGDLIEELGPEYYILGET